MGKCFVPNLHPSQVWMPSEYLVAHGQKVTLAIEESVIGADRVIEQGERTRFAMPGSFSLNGSAYAGVIVVTTHRFICCSSVGHNSVVVSMPFSQSVGIGNEAGLILKQIPISCDSVCVTVKASGESVKGLRDELLNAIEAAPNQKPIDFRGAAVHQQSAEPYRQVEKIKDAHRGERRLSKAEAAAYGPCPDCKGTVIVERDGKVCCLKCGHPLTAGK